MEAKFLGVPFVIWGVLCLALTVIWVIVWPKNKITTAHTVRFFILRWFHALVWLLLALAAFLAAFDLLGGTATAQSVAFLSLIVYLIFMGTFITSQ